MSTVSDELERIALSRNDQSERDELLKLWPAVLLMESERAAVGRLNKRVAELESANTQLVHGCERAMSDFRTTKAYAEETESQLRKRVQELETKAAEVVAELRKPTCHHANPYGCGWDEGRYAAADLITEKLGLK